MLILLSSLANQRTTSSCCILAKVRPFILYVLVTIPCMVHVPVEDFFQCVEVFHPILYGPSHLVLWTEVPLSLKFPSHLEFWQVGNSHFILFCGTDFFLQGLKFSSHSVGWN